MRFVHESFDLLCQAGVQLNSIFSSFSFWMVARTLFLLTYDAFTIIYRLKNFPEHDVPYSLIFWFLVDAVALFILCRSADLPVYQVSDWEIFTGGNQIEYEWLLDQRTASKTGQAVAWRRFSWKEMPGSSLLLFICLKRESVHEVGFCPFLDYFLFSTCHGWLDSTVGRRNLQCRDAPLTNCRFPSD